MDHILHLLGMVILVHGNCNRTGKPLTEKPVTQQPIPEKPVTEEPSPEKPFHDLYTAGNTKCRTDHQCDYHGYGYRWCYIDIVETWDYCCTEPCDTTGEGHPSCSNGNKIVECTEPTYTAVDGLTCDPDFPCGLHTEYSSSLKHWCYIDRRRQMFEECCPPHIPTPEGCKPQAG